MVLGVILIQIMLSMIQQQIKIIIFMSICGLNIGLVIDIFKLFVRQFLKNNKLKKVESLLNEINKLKDIGIKRYTDYKEMSI